MARDLWSCIPPVVVDRWGDHAAEDVLVLPCRSLGFDLGLDEWLWARSQEEASRFKSGSEGRSFVKRCCLVWSRAESVWEGL
jgi:hypothetical protein